MKVIDLFCGIGGWVQAFPRDWDVTGYDIHDFSDRYPFKFIQCDLLEHRYFPVDIDLIVASPPCTDFSKASFPKTWKSVQNYPPDIHVGIQLFARAQEIVREVSPRFWLIENVRGAQKFVGKADYHIGSRYFWSNFRLEYHGNGQDTHGKWKISPSPDRPVIRSMIPLSISRAIVDEMRKYAEVIEE